MTIDSTGRGGWTVSRHGSSEVEETLFALADGVLGVRASLEEQRSFSSGAYIAGVFEQTPIRYHKRLPGFAESSDTRVPVVDGMRLHLVAQGEAIGQPHTQPESCRWDLDFLSGVVTRTSTWLTIHGRLETRSERVTPGRPGASIALRYTVRSIVVPALVCSAPRLARTALEARISQLDGARANARALNHRRGALYPWRSIGGRECSAHYPSGSAQYHINAAIAQAIELYFTATSDETLLLDGGAELLWETARIWLDVGTFSPAYGGKFCIFGVTGPDEYSALVDNNFHTNRMAALHLKYAAQVYFELADSHPNAWEQLTSRLQLHRDEVVSWLAASNAMLLPYDATLAIDAQDERFLAKPRLALVSSDGTPLLLHYHPLTLYRHQVSKQADLILAMVFAGDGVPLDRLRRNLAYYEAVTTHDSTLSACAYAIVSAMAGLPDKALEYFRKTVFVDIGDLQGNVAHGSHMAALAGSILAIQWSFAGMTWRGGALGFRPALPESWTSVTFRMLWRGRLIGLEIGQSNVTSTLLQGEPLEISHFGEPFMLSASVDFDYPPLLANVT